MPSKAGEHVLSSYQDFMRYKGVPECLHRDPAPEQKSDNILELNRKMMVKDSYAVAGNANQNPVESMGVKIIKRGAETVMNYSGAPSNTWPYAHLYVVNVNDVCVSPFLGWETFI